MESTELQHSEVGKATLYMPNEDDPAPWAPEEAERNLNHAARANVGTLGQMLRWPSAGRRIRRRIVRMISKEFLSRLV